MVVIVCLASRARRPSSPIRSRPPRRGEKDRAVGRPHLAEAALAELRVQQLVPALRCLGEQKSEVGSARQTRRHRWLARLDHQIVLYQTIFERAPDRAHQVGQRRPSCDTQVWIGHVSPASIGSVESDGRSTMQELYAYAHLGALGLAARLRRRLACERGQGTVECVGLILLVSMLMVGMVVAMRNFNGSQGTEIAEVIIAKIKQAINAISFGTVPRNRPRRPADGAAARRVRRLGRVERRRRPVTAAAPPRHRPRRWRAHTLAPCPAATTAQRGPAPGLDRPRVRTDRHRLVPVRAGRDAGDLHRVGVGKGAALARGQGPRLGHLRVRDAPRVDRRAQGARLQARAPRRAVDRDPAADRARTARRRRPERAAGPLRLCRLRRAPGRRRHALRLDHRRLRRPAARDPEPARGGRARARSAHRVDRGDLVRRRRRRGALRPRLLRGLAGRGRREHRHDRRRRSGRGAGDRGATPVSRASSTSCSASPSRRSPPCARRRSRPAAGRCPADRVRLVVATRNPHKLAELEQIVGEDEARLVPLDEGVQLPPETGETFAENA